jgi:hypothetical protein
MAAMPGSANRWSAHDAAQAMTRCRRPFFAEGWFATQQQHLIESCPNKSMVGVDGK